ncbi:hypothetical protein [Solibacillus sp. FSL K6-1523]|uniref:hypothetical protein n=1 Tax=Solibacillus sp. FSL K6-1523 TaxID=2921471 RepID=UPI0030F9F238
MKDISWEMDEYFFFPNNFGAVAEVQSVKISPQWVPMELDNSMRLNGIYHFAVEVAFNDGREATLQKGTYIEDLDLNDNVGYFEYALPFSIDLPDTAKQLDSVKVLIEGEQSAVFDGGCQVKWNVRCQFEDHVAEKIDNQEIVVKNIEQKVELPAISETHEVTTVTETEEVTAISETHEVTAISETKEVNVSAESPVVSAVAETREVSETVVLKEVNEVAESPKQMEEELMYTVPSDDFYRDLSEAYKVHQVITPKARDNQS